MKTFILTCGIVISAAFTCRAFDWPAYFGTENARKVFLTNPPEPAAAQKTADCAYPANVRPQEARELIGTGRPVAIDIRTAGEYAAGHLEAATMQLDYYAPDFKEKLDKLDRNAEYLIYCRSGRRSGDALAMMTQDMGFTDAHHIDGGITAWTAAGYPVVK